jgi:hypothetical protein
MAHFMVSGADVLRGVLASALADPGIGADLLAELPEVVARWTALYEEEHPPLPPGRLAVDHEGSPVLHDPGSFLFRDYLLPTTSGAPAPLFPPKDGWPCCPNVCTGRAVVDRSRKTMVARPGAARASAALVVKCVGVLEANHRLVHGDIQFRLLDAI